MDWKDALQQFKDANSLPPGPEEKPDETSRPAKKETLHVVTDRRQRKGKTATIIEGFLCSDDEVAEIAKRLKQSLGIGGSSRDGEILLQGDCRQRVTEILKNEGYKVK